MKKLIVFCALIVSLCTNYARAEGTWTTLDMPGASLTRIFGIDGSNIVGVYSFNPGFDDHGFVFDGTNWTTLDMPGAMSTYATGIDGTNIVGYAYYIDYNYGAVRAHGFLFNGTSWITLEYGFYTFPQDIDGSNILGNNGQSTSFLYNGTSWTTLNIPLPGATHTFAYGIDGSNIVGSYMYGSQKSFLYNGETWTELPGYSVIAHGIDGSNIVGYSGWGYDISGYLYNGTSVTILDMPGAARTWLLGIDGNNIVGSYEDASGMHGLIYTITEPAIEAVVAFNPDTLNKNIKVQARYITACITLPEGYDVSSIDASTITITSLTGTDYQTDYYQAADLSFTPQVGDHDEDGIPDLTVKFDRQELTANLWVDDVAITVEGELLSGEHFKGIDHIRVIDKGK